MINEQFPDPTEQKPGQNQSIATLLPRYYETHGDNPSYEVEELIDVDGHEIAWLHYRGQIAYDILDRGREGQPYEGYDLQCACHFTEGVGWEVDEKYGVVGLMGADGCDKKDEAVLKRQLELRQQYYDLGMLNDTSNTDPETIKSIMLDLITKRQQNKFLEGGSGAEFWGGHYYLQTVQAIVGVPWKDVWRAVDQLVEDKQIRIEGMVVQTYHEPQQPETYKTDDVPEVVIYEEKPEKLWALVPRPDERELDLGTVNITNENHARMLGRCIVGLGQTIQLAEARLQEAIKNPRLSNERLYQQSFIETGYHLGCLAVIAYTARTGEQPEEWVVEAFLGDTVTPVVHTLHMDYPTIFGIDAADSANLNAMIDTWYPAAS
jgi:hypothetical protein